jgi:hypothetical protein
MKLTHMLAAVTVSATVLNAVPAAPVTAQPANAVAAPTVPAAARPTYPIRMLSPAEATADVALMRRALETIHPGLYRRASRGQINRAFARLERSAARGISDAELYRQVSLMLAEIRCNHTKAEQPRAIRQWRQTNPSHLPFRFTILQGRMIVVSADPTQTGLARGTEVLSINGRSVASLFATLGAYVPIDGKTIWSRATNLAEDGDLMGSDFDHFYPYVFGMTDTFDMVVTDRDGGPRRNVTMKPVAFDDWSKLASDGDGFRPNFSETTSWRLINAETAYLRVGTFVNYRRPVDASVFYGEIFAAIKASGATRLILDLRDNGGGSGDATYPLADFLTQRPFVWNRMIGYKAVRYGNLADSISTWGDREAIFNAPMDRFTRQSDGTYALNPSESPEELLPRTPSPDAFTGPVTILTSPANGSGSTMLIAKLADEGRVRLIGGRSGGSGDGPTAGRIFNVRLPASGIEIRVPNAFNAMQVASFERDGGITPDVLVEQSVADFRAGRDRVLETAVAERATAPAGPVVPDASAFLARFTGNWEGTLEYRDYQSNGRVTLPTLMRAELDASGQRANIAFTYDDGPGKTVFGGFSLGMDLSQAILSKRDGEGDDLYRVTGTMNPARGAPLNLVLWGRGTENDAPVDVRETLTVTATTYQLVRETRPVGQGAFQFRHAYNFTRKP